MNLVNREYMTFTCQFFKLWKGKLQMFIILLAYIWDCPSTYFQWDNIQFSQWHLFKKTLLMKI